MAGAELILGFEMEVFVAFTIGVESEFSVGSVICIGFEANIEAGAGATTGSGVVVIGVGSGQDDVNGLCSKVTVELGVSSKFEFLVVHGSEAGGGTKQDSETRSEDIFDEGVQVVPDTGTSSVVISETGAGVAIEAVPEHG